MKTDSHRDYLPKKLAKNAVRKIIVEKGIKNGAEGVAEWTPSGNQKALLLPGTILTVASDPCYG